jgi:hypothetical protein
MSDSFEELSYDIPGYSQKKKSNMDGLITLVPTPAPTFVDQPKSVFLRFYGTKVPLPSAVLSEVQVSPELEGHSFERWRSTFMQSPMTSYQGNSIEWEAPSKDYDEKLNETLANAKFYFPDMKNPASLQMMVLISNAWF